MTIKASDRAKISERAGQFVKAGRIEEAVAEYQKLLDGSGQDVSIGNIIGDLCLQLGQEDRAIELFMNNVETLERRGAYSQALAIAKKVNKIRPAEPDVMIRIGDLYGQLGFSGEAREQYTQAADEYEKRNETKPLIALYEKRARLDRTDLVTRLKLARLYLEERKGDQAQVVLNEAADLLFVRKEYGEAEKILLEALAVADGDYRTLTNLVRVYRELKRPETSMEMLGRIVKKRGPRTDLLSLMALLHSEQGDKDKAAEIYGRILAEDPGNYDIRAKLGIIEIERGRPDEALEIFDPLISHFLQKSDEDKAAGLLGLILMSGRMHLPTLERLAGVFRGVGRTKDLEVVLRVLLAEYRSESRDNDRIRILRELYILLPMDAGIAEEAETLGIRRELHQEAAEVAPEAGRPISEQDQEMLRLNLAKAELYLEQGLVRNARRILENLRLLYPDDPRIQKKIESLRAAPSVIIDKKIPEIVEETARREIDIIGPAVEPGMVVPPVSAPPLDLELLISDFAQPLPPETPIHPAAETPSSRKKGPVFSVRSGPAASRTKPAPPPPPPAPQAEAPDEEAGSKVTSAEIFAGLDIGPFVASAAGSAAASQGYIDITDKIEEEIEALEVEFYKQLKERTSVIEKDLVDIVQEFRRQVDIKVDQRNYESRYNLGLAFFEQNLYEEAIAEFELAAADSGRTADCWGLIGQCYVKKRNYPEARRRFEGAISLTPEESPERFALAYELASFYEMISENEAALALYREISAWNPKFRNTAKRIKILEKIVS